MMNISDVYVFKKVASSLSFTRAAREIGISRSAVSKQVTRLENSLGVVLFNRNTRCVNLTEAGRTFDAHTSNIDTAIEEAAELVRDFGQNPLGTVSITLPSSLGATLMTPLTTEFRDSWPELRLNLHFDDGIQDMIAGSLDLAIRICDKLPDSSLIAKRLCSTRKVLAASPRYLEQYGMPLSPADLKNHRCLGRGSANNPRSWRLEQDGTITEIPLNFSLIANNNLALVLAACLDSGIIYVPEICIANELANKQLQLISSIGNPSIFGVYALYPHRNAAKKVVVVVEFIEKMLARLDSLNRWSPLEERREQLTQDAGNHLAETKDTLTG